MWISVVSDGGAELSDTIAVCLGRHRVEHHQALSSQLRHDGDNTARPPLTPRVSVVWFLLSLST